MQHWYVYHSIETMGYAYKDIGSSAVYSLSNRPKLCFNDVIWVVEGDKSNPKNFKLVDCFINTMQEYPPFIATYSKFKLKILGKESLIKTENILTKDNEWFAELHLKFITRQKFFNVLPEQIFKGLMDISGIKL